MQDRKTGDNQDKIAGSARDGQAGTLQHIAHSSDQPKQKQQRQHQRTAEDSTHQRRVRSYPPDGNARKQASRRQPPNKQEVKLELRAKISRQIVGVSPWSHNSKRLQQEHIMETRNEQESREGHGKGTVRRWSQPARQQQIDQETRPGKKPLIHQSQRRLQSPDAQPLSRELQRR